MKSKIKKLLKNFRITRSAFSYPYILFMLIFVVLPLALILINAFMVDQRLSFGNFISLVQDRASLPTLLTSLLVGLVTTITCLVVGYPVAYILAKRKSGRIIALLFILPMWVNFLIRTLSTRAMFEALGIDLGMGTVIFGMVYNFIPFMILPLHTTLSISIKAISGSSRLGGKPVNSFS